MEPIKNNSELLYKQAIDTFDQAQQEFESGQIKTEVGLVEKVFTAFEHFFVELGRPNLTPRYVVEGQPPSAEDYNKMMDEIKKDFDTLYREIDLIGKSMVSDFNHQIMEQKELEERRGSLSNKLKELEIYSGKSKDGVLDFARESFLNSGQIDYDRITGKPLEIHPSGVTLPLKSEKNNVALGGSVSIIKGNQIHEWSVMGSESNGFPGNSTEIKVIPRTDTDARYYDFIGADNNHSDYGSIIDGEPNTWFEYEKISVRDHDKKKKAKNFGWSYNVGDDHTVEFEGIPDNGVLRLHVHIKWNQPETINQINLNMFTPPNYLASKGKVENILVSMSNGEVISVLGDNHDGSQYHFQFEPIEAVAVSVIFTQKEKYYTDLGHIFYREVKENNQQEYMIQSISGYDDGGGIRMNGPLINIESIGVDTKEEKGVTKSHFPYREAGSNPKSMTDAYNELNRLIDTKKVEMGIERFEGWRWAIGIRDIEVLSCEYEEQGELVTTPFRFEKPIEKIAISTEDYFSDTSSLDDKEILYYVSIDDGGSWHAITPLEHKQNNGDPVKIYTVHETTDNSTALSKAGYIETPHAAFELRVKIVARKKTEAEGQIKAFASSYGKSAHYTPKVKGFMVEVEGRDEASDSVASTTKAAVPEFIRFDPEDGLGGETGKEQGPSDLTGFPEFPPELEDEASEPPTDGDDEPEDEDNEEMPIFFNVSIHDSSKGLCECDYFFVKGTYISSHKRTELYLSVEDERIDIFNLGQPPEGKNCNVELPSNSITEKPSKEYEGGYEGSFQFYLPYWRIDQFNPEPGSFLKASVTGENEYVEDVERATIVIEDCEDDETSSTPEDECYKFEGIVLEYYNEYKNVIDEFEVDGSLLPYEIDNGEGTKVTLGYDGVQKTATVMVTDGYNESGAVFQINAIGLRYTKAGSVETVWAQTVTEQSSDNRYMELIPGDPDSKESEWLEDIYKGNYSTAPSLGSINSFVSVSFGSMWWDKGCVTPDIFSKEEYRAPETPQYDGTMDKIRDCNNVEKIIFQYFNQKKKEFQVYQIDIEDSTTKTYQIEDKNGTVDLIVGWYDLMKGPMIHIKTSKGDDNVILSGLGVVYSNMYGVNETKWIEDIAFKTNTVKNEGEMIGKPLSENEEWFTNALNGSLATVPLMGKQEATVVGRFNDSFSGNLCEVVHKIENHKDFVAPSNAIKIVYPTERSMSFQSLEVFHNVAFDYYRIPLPFKVEVETSENLTRVEFVQNGTYTKQFPVEQEPNELFKRTYEVHFRNDYYQREYNESEKIDLIFVVDTSNSAIIDYSNMLEHAKERIHEICIDLLKGSSNTNFDIRIAYVNTSYEAGKYASQSFVPYEESTYENLEINGGEWETLEWKQIFDESYGAAKYFKDFRDDAYKYVFVYSGKGDIDGEVSGNQLNMLMEEDIRVSFTSLEGPSEKLQAIAEATKGIYGYKHESIEKISYRIFEDVSWFPTTTYTLTTRAIGYHAEIVAEDEITIDLYDEHKAERKRN